VAEQAAEQARELFWIRQQGCRTGAAQSLAAVQLLEPSEKLTAEDTFQRFFRKKKRIR
jgi:hypothetical protein